MRDFESKQLEERINSSPALTLDPVREATLYQRAVFSLIEDLYRYLNRLSGRYADMGLEIVETAHECLKAFRPERGAFLHYYLASIKRRAMRKAAEEQLSLTLSEELPADHSDGIAGLSGREDTVEQAADSALFLQLFLHQAEAEFLRCQARQQPVVSKLLTVKLLAEFPELAEGAMPTAFSFLDAGICDAYSRTGDIPSLRELSAQLGRNEASTSRTLKQFLERVRHAMAL